MSRNVTESLEGTPVEWWQIPLYFLFIVAPWGLIALGASQYGK